VRQWLVVLDDPGSDFTTPEELEDYLRALLENDLGSVYIARVQRGGLLAKRIMEELPPVRHALMGRRRG
jgi:hypothetical protein